MISTEEFQQTLQAGQVQEALTLLFQSGFATELDVTTQMTEDATMVSQSASREYLRTKINLLTGEIQNEVGRDLTIDSTSYLKLQQLHLDRIVASYRIVQDYLDRIQTIVSILSPTSSSGDLTVSSDRLTSDSLVARLTQATTDLGHQQLASDTTVSPNSSDLSQQQSPVVNNAIHPVAADSDIDLYVDEDGEVWEKWAEDEDFISAAAMSQPPAAPPALTIEHVVRRHFNPTIEVKPIIARPTPELVNPTAQWEKFAPEYVGISADPKPQFSSNNDAHQMDKLLADLDL
jgi:hypothetical protein